MASIIAIKGTAPAAPGASASAFLGGTVFCGGGSFGGAASVCGFFGGGGTTFGWCVAWRARMTFGTTVCPCAHGAGGGVGGCLLTTGGGGGFGVQSMAWAALALYLKNTTD